MFNHDKHILIIGGGLGGLSCGALLARGGYRVTVLEQNSVIGGCLQCFTRRGVKFETGMHYVGSLGEGESLDILLRHLGIRDRISFSRLDDNCYDIISLAGQHFNIASGRENFIDSLAAQFPQQRPNLQRYFDLVEAIAASSRLGNVDQNTELSHAATQYQLQAVDQVLAETISDPLLAAVIAGNNPLYAGVKGVTPFTTHAFIHDFYTSGAYRVTGGSDAVARALVEVIKEAGGEVFTSARVTRIITDDTHATGVAVSFNGIEETIEADTIISAIHPALTINLCDSHLLRPIFRRRIAEMPQTSGAFCLYLHFKDGAMPYLNSNFFCYSGTTPWGCTDYTPGEPPKGYLYMHHCHQENPTYARGAIIIAYMHYDEVRRWEGTAPMQRGAEYEDFKAARAEQLLNLVEHDHPGLRAAIKHYYTSTPLTYRDYTGTLEGSIYGVAKSVTADISTHVPYRTRIPNLLLAGQNVNSHGMLGTLVGTFVTCATLLPITLPSS